MLDLTLSIVSRQGHTAVSKPPPQKKNLGGLDKLSFLYEYLLDWPLILFTDSPLRQTPE